MNILDKFKDLEPTYNEAITNAMLIALVATPNNRQDDMWIRDGVAGNVCVYKDNRYPNHVIEYVLGSKDDSVTTLFIGHPVFASRQLLIDLRKELITGIAVATMSLPSTVMVRDEGRERDAYLMELGTAQLVDIMTNVRNGS
jgi:hypothetical protein